MWKNKWMGFCALTIIKSDTNKLKESVESILKGEQINFWAEMYRNQAVAHVSGLVCFSQTEASVVLQASSM